MEAFSRVEEITGKPMAWRYVEKARDGDHICYISNLDKIMSHYPNWKVTRSLDDIFSEIVTAWETRIQ
jgi:CDP-paratose 2-epimerase